MTLYVSADFITNPDGTGHLAYPDGTIHILNAKEVSEIGTAGKVRVIVSSVADLDARLAEANGAIIDAIKTLAEAAKVSPPTQALEVAQACQALRSSVIDPYSV